MKSLAALPAGGTDQHDMSGGAAVAGLGFHLCNRIFHQPENAIEIDRQRGAPLFVGHAIDGHILFRPDAVVGDENVEPSEMPDGLGHERARRLRIIQIARDRMTRRLRHILSPALRPASGRCDS